MSIAEALARAGGIIEDALSRSGADRHVTVMAATKTLPAGTVAAAISAGVRVVGENRVSEGGRKIAALGRHAAEFHVIGPFFNGEIRQALRDFDSIDTVSSIEAVEALAARTVSRRLTAPRFLLEVNTSGEASKHGFPPEIGLLEEVCGRCVDLGTPPGGLFTVGPLSLEEASSRAAFSRLRTLRDGLSAIPGLTLRELSMGMSDDFHWAVMEGATTVRLGRFLFGSRRLT